CRRILTTYGCNTTSILRTSPTSHQTLQPKRGNTVQGLEEVVNKDGISFPMRLTGGSTITPAKFGPPIRGILFRQTSCNSSLLKQSSMQTSLGICLTLSSV